MRIWKEIELYKSGEKSRAFLANNLHFLHRDYLVRPTLRFMQLAPKSQSQVTATAEMPIYSELWVRKTPILKPKLE